jgi:proteasome lid subunit RPN8/RPN11
MPDHKLEISGLIWKQLISDLARTGRGIKESGAFLLGSMAPNRTVTEYLLYSDIAPDSQHVNYVLLRGRHMAKVWDICEQKGLRVVADIHTHPGVPIQSTSDRENPIVSIKGHIALIVPNFAQGVVLPSSLGFHEFQGQGVWHSWFRAQAAGLLRIKG